MIINALKTLRRQINRFRRFMYENSAAGIHEKALIKEAYDRGYRDAERAAEEGRS